jgi:sensor histidine kinase YesM
LRSARQDGRLLLEVKDNGVGIPAEALEQVVQKGPGEQGIGINNVRERLRVLYGSDFTFQIESQPGGGTSIRLGIPLLTN